MLRDGRNALTAQDLMKYLKPIDEADDELASMLGEYRNACRGPRGRIKNAKAAAKEAGINPTAFNAMLITHRADRAEERRRAGLEADDADDYDAMVSALGAFGDTPLGDAALRKAKPRGEEALDGLDVPPAGRADEANLDGVGRGR